MIKNNLYTCLRNSTFNWYIFILSENYKKWIRGFPGGVPHPVRCRSLTEFSTPPPSQKKNEIENIFQNFFVDNSISCNLIRQCRKCDVKCFFNNRLHKHFKTCRKLIIMQRIVDSIDFQMIEFKKITEANENYDIALRKWHYFMIKIFIIKFIFDFFCLNIECEMFMIDRIYLNKFLFDYKSKIKT